MRIKTLIIALALICCAASVYAVRWYRGFYHHVTHEELSHAVKHSTFQVTIRSGQALEMQLYQQEHATDQPLVLFTSGDGGWSPFCADIAAHIAATGITVAGIDVKSYLVNFATPQKPLATEDLARDYSAIAKQAIAQPGIDNKAPLVLAGWSVGAGYSVIAASQQGFGLPLTCVIAISLPAYGELAWRPADSIIYFTHGTPREKVFDIRPFLKTLKQTPIVFLNATSDKNTPLREAQSLYDLIPGAKRFYAVKAGGHHFEGGEKEFYQDLDLVLSQQQIADKSDNKLKEAEVARD